MSAVTGSGNRRGAREAYANVASCETCIHRVTESLFTLCGHPESEYSVSGIVQLHTIQHMRDIYVGLCGADAKLREVS